MINIIDLFSGCGGLTEGFLQTKNFKTLAAVDWELQTVRTLKSRLSNKWGYQSLDNKILHFDIQRTDELINGFDDPVFGKSKGLDQLVGEIIKKGEQTLLLTIINNNGERRYLGVKIN